jgi:hypothetical protein
MRTPLQRGIVIQLWKRRSAGDGEYNAQQQTENGSGKTADHSDYGML